MAVSRNTLQGRQANSLTIYAQRQSEGENVGVLTATPDKGFLFKEWQVVSGDVTIHEDKFVMPAGDVVIKAVFERPAPPPQTGDSANPGWWMLAACAALVGLGAVAAHGRKRRTTTT